MAAKPPAKPASKGRPTAKTKPVATAPAAPSGADITEVHFTAFVSGPTKNPAALTAILGALAHDELLAPTHGSQDEKKRAVFDLEALALAGGTKIGDPLVWRTRAPKYWGSINASPLAFARVLLHFEAIDGADIEPVVTALGKLATRLQPAYAALHFKWADGTKEQLASLAGISAKDLQFGRAGPPGVFAWTWFGPELTEALGLGNLLGLGATPMPGGGASLPLLARPWAAPFAELRARQLEIDAALRKKGLFGDYTTSPVQPGPKWKPRKLAETNT